MGLLLCKSNRSLGFKSINLFTLRRCSTDNKNTGIAIAAFDVMKMNLLTLKAFFFFASLCSSNLAYSFGGEPNSYGNLSKYDGYCSSQTCQNKLRIVYEGELEFWQLLETADNSRIVTWLSHTEDLLADEGKALFEREHPYQRLAHLYSFGCLAYIAPTGNILPPLRPFLCHQKYQKLGGNLWGSTGNEIMQYLLNILSAKTLLTLDYGEIASNLDKMMNLGPRNIEGYVVTAMMLSILKDRNGSNNLRRAIEIMNDCQGEICSYSPTPMAPSKKVGMNFVLAEMLYIMSPANKERALAILRSIKPLAKNNVQLNWISDLENEIRGSLPRIDISPLLVRFPVPRYFRKNACVLCHAGASEVFKSLYSDRPQDIMKLRFR